MRIRKATIAGATALAVAFSGTATAVADTTPAEANQETTNTGGTDGQNTEKGNEAETPNKDDEGETPNKDNEGENPNKDNEGDAPGDKTETPGSSSFNLSSKDGEKADPDKKDEIGALSSKIGKSLEADKPAKGTDLFGVDTNWSEQPKWAQALLGIGITSAIITVLSGVLGPILNFIKFGPLF